MNMMLGYLIGINAVTFLVMLFDKLQASSHSRRVSERTLFILTFLGGTPAMVFSMYTIRHKSRKLSFQLMVWLILLIHVVLIASLLDPSFVHLPEWL